MILLSFFSTVEFYVIMSVIAAAIVAFSARPQSRGPVMEYLLASELSETDDHDLVQQSVELTCLADDTVLLVRHGVEDVTMTGAVSLAAKCDGSTITFEERLVAGSSWDAPARKATFHIDFLRPGRYHIRYNSDRTGLFAAFPLHVRPGINATHILSR